MSHNPNFAHRLASISNLEDDIGLMTDRALGILYLLSSQFEGDVSRMNDTHIYNAIDAVINEIHDIDSRMKAEPARQVLSI